MAAITFQCYACNQVLQVEADKAGRKAKCSQCGTILTIPVLAADAVLEGAAAPLPSAPQPPSVPAPRRDEVAVDEPQRRRADDDDGPRRRDIYDDDPPRRRRPDDYDNYAGRRASGPKWDKVKVGLLLSFIGLCVMGGAFGLMVLGTLVSFFSISGMLVLYRIATMIFLMGLIAAIVGHVFWLFVFSNRRGAMGFAIAALAVAGVFLLMQIVSLAQSFGAFFGVHNVTHLFSALLRAAYLMMIAFYVRSLAQWFDDRRLEASGMINVILTGCLAGYELLTGVILMSIFSGGFGQGSLALMSILHLLGGAFIIVIFVFTLLAVYRCKALVDAVAVDEAAPRYDDIRR